MLSNEGSWFLEIKKLSVIYAFTQIEPKLKIDFIPTGRHVRKKSTPIQKSFQSWQ